MTTVHTTHPFLNHELPIEWPSLTPQKALIDIPVIIEKTEQALNKIVTLNPKNITYEHTFEAFDTALNTLNSAWSLFQHLKAVADSPEVRQAYQTLLPQITAFTTALYLNKNLYQALKTAYSLLKNTPELSAPFQRFMVETLEDFREQGAELSENKAEQLKTLHQALAQVTQQFTENILDTTHEWELIIKDQNELSGLPPSALQAAFENAQSKEKGSLSEPAWRFTLHAPSMGPILDYADNETLRKTVWKGAQTIGCKPEKDNRLLIPKILQLRSEIAHLLGKADFPALTLNRRMAKSGVEALAFIENLKMRILPTAKKEWADLMHFRAQSLNLDHDELLEPWDVAYWMEKWRKAEYDFDEEALRPYFSENQVIAGLFELSSQLFHIQIEALPLDNHPVWANHVHYYAVKDLNTHKILGYFYTDWYPRETKREGAWMSSLFIGNPFDAKTHQPHVGTINGNFTPPINNQPAQLNHIEVQTLFHEFGHLLHHLLSEVPVKSLSGVNVAWDFVEFPSQIMENWCWERHSLDLFAKHAETQSTLPEGLFHKMTQARNFMAANKRLRQLMLAKLDLELHLHPERYIHLTPHDLEIKLREALDGYFMPLKTTPPLILPKFSHIFGSSTGYAAGYYSYQWAEVLEADAFSKFLTAPDGLLSPTIGQSLRNTVLNKGNSRPADELFYDFMQRAPNPNALLKRDGLI